MAHSASNGSATLMASELTARARESAAALEYLLQAASTTAMNQAQHDDIRELAEKIFCCLDRALAALQSEGCSPSKKRRSPSGTVAQARPKRRARGTAAEMPTRVEKRSTPDDGLLWRKYGQKDILNSKYPRTYFRCTYKYENGCKATRQVQQSEDDPSIYVVTYYGEHTCGMDAAVGEEKRSPQLVINFGSRTTSSGSPWLSSSDDVGSNSPRLAHVVCLPEKQDGGEQKANVFNVESSVAPPAEASSSADESCASPNLDSFLQYFDWESSGDNLFDMELINNFDEEALRFNSVL